MNQNIMIERIIVISDTFENSIRSQNFYRSPQLSANGDRQAFLRQKSTRSILRTLEEFVLWSEMQQDDYSLAKISIFAALSLTFEEIPIASIYSTRLFTWFQQMESE